MHNWKNDVFSLQHALHIDEELRVIAQALTPTREPSDEDRETIGLMITRRVQEVYDMIERPLNR